MKHTNLLTQEDIKRFEQIDRDCIAMHVCPPPKTFIELSVTDGDGVEVERYTDRAHSWVRNMYNAFCQMMMGGKDAAYGAGSLRQLTIAGANSSSTLPLATEYLLWLSTNTDAESFETTAFARIANGSAAGQLVQPSFPTNSVPTYDSGTKKWTVTKTVVCNNNSGASVVVGSVALINNNASIMLCRDLLASAVTVPNAGQLTVTYTIEMTFPA